VLARKVAIAGLLAVAVTAWLTNADQAPLVVAALVAAAVVLALVPSVERGLSQRHECRKLLARRAQALSEGGRLSESNRRPIHYG
jgi:hypothetical protein